MSEAKAQASRLEVLYVLLGVVGLAGTWAQAFGYLDAGFVAGNIRFWKETVATPASTFITVDVLVLAAALFAWMFGEARRVGIAGGWLWVYFLLSLVVAISFAVPVFLAHRQRRIRLQRPDEVTGPSGTDWVAVVVLVAIAVGAAGYSLLHTH